MNGLKKCPFCGNGDKVDFEFDVFGKAYGIGCDNCGGIFQWPRDTYFRNNDYEYLPIGTAEKDIAMKWNQRIE